MLQALNHGFSSEEAHIPDRAGDMNPIVPAGKLGGGIVKSDDVEVLGNPPTEL